MIKPLRLFDGEALRKFLNITILLNPIKKKGKLIRFTPILILLVCLSSCVSYDQLVNFQGAEEQTEGQALNIPAIRIQANSVLDIKVFGVDTEIAAPFNVASTDNIGNFLDPQSIQLVGYLVNKEGFIDFPVLGKISVAGLTTTEATDLMVKKLGGYLKSPVVRIRLLNFTVTVTGEVNRQGSFTVFNDRISLPEALALAEGLTDYANRKDILIVREDSGKRIFKRVDLSSANFFQSEYYYLRQNDMIYVEPIKAKRGAIADQTNKTLPIFSAIGTLVAVIIALVK